MNIQFGSIIRPIVRPPENEAVEYEPVGPHYADWVKPEELFPERAERFVLNTLHKPTYNSRTAVFHAEGDTVDMGYYTWVKSYPVVLIDDEEGAHATNWRRLKGRLDRAMEKYNEYSFNPWHWFVRGPAGDRAAKKLEELEKGYAEEAKPVEFVVSRKDGRYVMVKNGLESRN